MPSSNFQNRSEILTQFKQLLAQLNWQAAASKLIECPDILYWLAQDKDWQNIQLVFIHCYSLDVNFAVSPEKNVPSPMLLWTLVFNEQKDLFNTALKKSFDINFNVRPFYGENKDLTLLALLAKFGWWEELDFIMKNYPDLDLSTQRLEVTNDNNLYVSTPILYLAIKAGKFQILKTMFDFHHQEFYRNLLCILLMEVSLDDFKMALDIIKQLDLKIDINFAPFGNSKFESNIASFFYVKTEDELLGAAIPNLLSLRLHFHPAVRDTNKIFNKKRVDEACSVLAAVKEQFPEIDGNKKITGKGRFQGISLFWSLAYMDKWEFLYHWLNGYEKLTIDISGTPTSVNYYKASFFALITEAAIKEKPYSRQLLDLMLKRDISPDAFENVKANGILDQKNTILSYLTQLSDREVLAATLLRAAYLKPDFMLYFDCHPVSDFIYFLQCAFENPVSVNLRELTLPTHMVSNEEVLIFLSDFLSKTSIEKIFVLYEGKSNELGFQGYKKIEVALENNKLNNINYDKACQLLNMKEEVRCSYREAHHQASFILELLDDSKEHHDLSKYVLINFYKEMLTYLNHEDAFDFTTKVSKGLFLIYIDNFCYDMGSYLFLSDYENKSVECYWLAACFLSEAICQMKKNDLRFDETSLLLIKSLLICLGVFNNLNGTFNSLKSNSGYPSLINKLIDKKQDIFCYPPSSSVKKLSDENWLQNFNIPLMSCLDVHAFCNLITISRISRLSNENFPILANKIQRKTLFFEKIAPDCKKWVQENLAKNVNDNCQNPINPTL